MKNVPHWAQKLESLVTGLPILNSKKACEELMRDIITKMFNSRGNAIVKRYFSTYLARGGKKASQSSNRETQKHEGLGKHKIKSEGL